MPKTGRNQPCPCKSGLKYKHCHGDLCKQQICNLAANQKMISLIHEEQIKKGIRCKHGQLKTKHCPSCKVED